MPRVKIDYVVSFSSEDPDNPASNLLASEVSRKKWLCTSGTATCSVVLQLARCVRISNLQVGAHHASMVEVLVGRSEAPDQQYKVLVPICVFITPSESRNGDNVERVRSFNYEQLANDSRDLKWDRVRVVCSQPYNKHCKYGLSFIHIFEPEGNQAVSSPSVVAPVPIPPRLLELDSKSSDDEDTFKPGDLFAQYQANSQDISTDAQIRQATAKALKNIPESSKTKSPMIKNKSETPTSKTAIDKRDILVDRHRDELLYTADDDRPNARIDKVIEQHHSEKNKKETREKERFNIIHKKHDDQQSKHDRKKDSTSRHTPDSASKNSKVINERTKGDDKNDVSSRKQGRDSKKRSLPADNPSVSGERKKAKRSRSPHRLLEGVTFVLSGYENPTRAALRSSALAMGARCERDWTPLCTHLICAFPNTPKLRSVRASKGGDKAVVVTGDWIEQCCSRRRLLPWQWFATEPKRRLTREQLPESEDEEEPVVDDTEMDTDDEIEKVLQEQKVQESLSGDDKADLPQDRSNDSDVTFVTDERVKGHVTLSDSDTDAASPTSKPDSIDISMNLPDLFDGKTFVIDETATEAGFETNTLKRYVKAYGGEVLEGSHLDEETTVNYTLCGASPSHVRVGSVAVRADWLWLCHQQRKLLPLDAYLLQTNPHDGQ